MEQDKDTLQSSQLTQTPSHLTTNTFLLYGFVGVVMFLLGMALTYVLTLNKNQPPPVLPQPSPLITMVSPTSVVPSSDPTAGWKTYENALYQYSFKYPPKSKIIYKPVNKNVPESGNADTVLINLDEVKQIEILVSDLSSNLQSLKEEAMQLGSRDGLPDPIVLEKSTQNLPNYYSVTTSNNQRFAIIPIPKNSSKYAYFTSGNIVLTDDAFKIFDQILSTFKFTN